MEPTEAIGRLCDLVSKVGEKKFDHTFAHDCFCGKNPIGGGIGSRVDEPVIEFIEKAVQVALESK